MRCFLVSAISIFLITELVQSLSYDPDDYLEVYPDPRDPEVLQGRIPLHFAFIQSQSREFNSSGSVAGVKVALDRINNDNSLLPGYTLHFTYANSEVCDQWVDSWSDSNVDVLGREGREGGC